MNKFQKLRDILALKSYPIGVKLVYNHNRNPQEDFHFKEVHKLEGFCEYVKKASQGEFLKVRKGDFTCHTGNVMLGFEVTDNLELTMRLDSKGLKYIHLFPINDNQPEAYDSIILILNPFKCMKIIQAYVSLYKKPLKITCGIINGVCSEVAAFVIKRNEVNFSFLCSNSRSNGIFDDCELLCGIPGKIVEDIIDEIINLNLTPFSVSNS